MRRFLCLVIASLLLTAAACASGGQSSSDIAEESGRSDSSAESADIMKRASKVISSLNYTNSGKMGDTDGPAFAVYSKIGYRGAAVKMDIADMEIETLMSDGRFINGYAFLGIDVYGGEAGSEWWINCIDAGLCWSGEKGGWHVFYNIYEPLNESTSTWYESSKILPKNDVYAMSLVLTEDNYALLTVKGQRTGAKDTVKIEVKGAKKDGSNTSFLFNTALDYPPDTKVDREGNACEDWTEITLANTDKGLYLRSFHVSELMLFRGEEWDSWTDGKNQAVGIWPDKAVDGFDYSPVEVGIFDGTEYYINLDMNR